MVYYHKNTSTTVCILPFIIDAFSRHKNPKILKTLLVLLWGHELTK